MKNRILLDNYYLTGQNEQSSEEIVSYDINSLFHFFFFQAEDGIRDYKVTGVQTCALPISRPSWRMYTRTPRPSRSMMASALWSCEPQSQRREPNTSPVRHSECTRTSTGSSVRTSPFTRATGRRSSTVVS